MDNIRRALEDHPEREENWTVWAEMVLGTVALAVITAVWVA